MLSQISYSIDGRLEKQIRQKKIIPYMIFPNEKYKINKWYYSYYYDNVFKVEEVEYNEDGSLNSAYIKTDENTYSYITTDLDLEDYSVYKDRREIYKMNIINNSESFTGAEIVYWFFINNITSFDKKYHGFWKYIDRYSKDRINDRDRYYIKAKLIGTRYVDCKFIVDNQASDRMKEMTKKIHSIEDNKFMLNLKKKDMKRMKALHSNDK